MRIVLCLQVQPVFSKCMKKSLAVHLATHSSSFSCHIKNHPVTAGLVLSQDLSVEANGNKFRLCCICGAQEEVTERYRAAANLLLQDSLHRRNGLSQLNTQRFRTRCWILLNCEAEDQVCVCQHSWTSEKSISMWENQPQSFARRSLLFISSVLILLLSPVFQGRATSHFVSFCFVALSTFEGVFLSLSFEETADQTWSSACFPWSPTEDPQHAPLQVAHTRTPWPCSWCWPVCSLDCSPWRRWHGYLLLKLKIYTRVHWAVRERAEESDKRQPGTWQLHYVVKSR